MPCMTESILYDALCVVLTALHLLSVFFHHLLSVTLVIIISGWIVCCFAVVKMISEKVEIV